MNRMSLFTVLSLLAITAMGATPRIGGGPFKIVVADNGAKAMKSEVEGGPSELKPYPVANADVRWIVNHPQGGANP
jgi:hypothetical protein